MSITTTVRRCVSGVAAALLAVAIVFAGGSPAQAASGSGYIYRAPGSSFGYYSYTNVNSARTDFRLLSQPRTLSSGYCYDLWLDHTNATGGHYDARVSRSCRSNTNRDTGPQIDSLAGNGLNKLGVCYGPNNNTNSPLSNCLMNIGSMSAVSTNLPNNCNRAWIMSSGASTLYYSGGNSYSCTS